MWIYSKAVKFYEFIEKICEQRGLTVMTLTVKSFFCLLSKQMSQEIAREVILNSDDEWYVADVLENEVPNIDVDFVFSEFKFANRNAQKWWYDFVDIVNEFDDEAFERLMSYDYHNFTKLEILSDWVKNIDLGNRLYQYELNH